MAQLKSTSVTGNLSVTGNVVASKLIKSDGIGDDILLANGEVTSLQSINDDISEAQETADTALAAANLAQKYARLVYGDKDNTTPQHNVLSNHTAITQLSSKHDTDKQALDDKITQLTQQHNTDIQTLNTTHTTDIANLNTIKLNNNTDGTIAGSLTVDDSLIASSFIKKDGTSNEILLADGSTQKILTLDRNVNEDSIKDIDPNIDPDKSHTHFYNAPILTGLILEADNKLKAQRRKLEELGINLVYNFKGSITGTNFRTLTNISVGDVYHITSQYPTTETSPILAEGEDWVCHTAFTTAITNFDTTYTLYWSKLTNHIDLSGYLQKSGGRLNGGLQWYNASTSPILNVGTDTSSTTILRITRTNDNVVPLNDNQYGYSLIYNNSTTNTSNTLSLMCDNNISPDIGQIIGWRINQNGYIGIGMSPNSNHKVAISGSIYLNRNTSTLLAVSGDTVLSMDSDKYLTLQNKNQIKFLTSTNSKTTIYDVDGNWTMPNSLILNKGTNDDVYIELLRDAGGTDWKILNSGGNLAIQCNHSAADADKSYYPVVTMAYDTGNITTKGNILPEKNDEQSLGSGIQKWYTLYSTNVYSTTVNSTNVNATTVNLNTAQNSSGGTIDFTSNKSIGNSDNIWNTANVYQLNLHRGKSSTGGRIYFYNGTSGNNNYTTWVEYMSDTETGSCPTGSAPIAYGNVTTWARRSIIENESNYGWIWESVAEPTKHASASKQPQAMMALSSQNGNLFLRGSLTLHETATFEYNSIDKCIDVKFT